jgi:hypothetical protein
MAGPEPDELARLHERLERDRAIIERSMFSGDTRLALSLDTSLTRERIRQIVRRASKQMGLLVRTDPRFAMLAEEAGAFQDRASAQRPATPVPAAGIVPAMHQPHNASITVSRPAERKAERRPQINLPTAMEGPRSNGLSA